MQAIYSFCTQYEICVHECAAEGTRKFLKLLLLADTSYVADLHVLIELLSMVQIENECYTMGRTCTKPAVV